ncbi:MAG: hypothetical protein WBD52_12635 [Phycisphaerae bacterium]
MEPAVVGLAQFDRLAVQRHLAPREDLRKERKGLGPLARQEDEVELRFEFRVVAGDGNAVRDPLDPGNFGGLRRDGNRAQVPHVRLIDFDGDFDLDARPLGLAAKEFPDQVRAHGFPVGRSRRHKYQHRRHCQRALHRSPHRVAGVHLLEHARALAVP